MGARSERASPPPPPRRGGGGGGGGAHRTSQEPARSRSPPPPRFARRPLPNGERWSSRQLYCQQTRAAETSLRAAALCVARARGEGRAMARASGERAALFAENARGLRARRAAMAGVSVSP